MARCTADDLEEVMTRFVEGKADVLLSTTIIESGIDIPNANTIIIDRADRFGLSDLYQLRGRVGRYKHQAYAYFLLPRHAGLLADARKRIGAIRQYSSLGSGFKIAMRDLEIRGAGNLLGPEQSGHITAVGFELYCQLLKQSISRLKGEKVKPRLNVQARFDFLALSPGEEGVAAPRRVASGPPDSIVPEIPRASVRRSPAYVPPGYVERCPTADRDLPQSGAGDRQDRPGPVAERDPRPLWRAARGARTSAAGGRTETKRWRARHRGHRSEGRPPHVDAPGRLLDRRRQVPAPDENGRPRQIA